MSVGTRVDSSSGVVTTKESAGVTLERNAQNKGFTPFQVDAVGAYTSNVTMSVGEAGVMTVSGNAVVTLVTAKPSDCPGAEFVVRTLSAHAHVLTGSQESQGTLTFAGGNGGATGSKLTFPAVVGSSVFLKSDGLKYLVVASSGSATISGT